MLCLPYDNRIQHQVEIPPGDELTPALKEKYAASAMREDVARGRGDSASLEELDGAVVNVELTAISDGRNRASRDE